MFTSLNKDIEVYYKTLEGEEMNKSEFMEKVRGKLIVSCQALEGEPLYLGNTTIMPYMAKAAQQAGAAGIRTNGVMDVIAIKKEVSLPIIGLIKHKFDGYEPFITPTMSEIDQLVKAKADVIAFDCTMRKRVDEKDITMFIKEVKEKYPNQLFMADISNFEEGMNASQAGIDFIGTTLSGYTSYTQERSFPDFELVQKLSQQLDTPIFAEGRIHSPAHAKKMLDMGAFSVVVGGAITRPLEIAQRFVNTMKG